MYAVDTAAEAAVLTCGSMAEAVERCYDGKEIAVTGYGNPVLVHDGETAFRMDKVQHRTVDFLATMDKS